MNLPCKHSSPVEGCRVCWLFANDPLYEAFFMARAATAPPAPTSFAERVYLINLERRPDRLKAAMTEFNRVGITPTVFKAIDGKREAKPSTFVSGSGAWGCRESHRLILEECLRDGVQTVAVFEDDAVFAKDFNARLPAYLAELPSDWQAAFLGGQHLSPPTYVSEGVVKCGGEKGCHRTHGYLARDGYIQTLRDVFANSNTHIDWAWGSAQKHHTVYAPTRWLVYQSAGQSDINGRNNPEKRWEPKHVIQNGKTRPVILNRPKPIPIPPKKVEPLPALVAAEPPTVTAQTAPTEKKPCGCKNKTRLNALGNK